MTDDNDLNTSQELPLLTFNSLLNFLREEKKNKILTKIPDLFYEALEKYLESKKEEILKLKNDISSKQKLDKEKYILKKSKEVCLELINLRCVKISNIAIKNKIFGDDAMNEQNILEREEIFLKKVQSNIVKVKGVNI